MGLSGAKGFSEILATLFVAEVSIDTDRKSVV